MSLHGVICVDFRYCCEIHHTAASNTWNRGSNEGPTKVMLVTRTFPRIKSEWSVIKDGLLALRSLSSVIIHGKLDIAVEEDSCVCFVRASLKPPGGLHMGPPLRRLSRNRSLTEGGSVSIVLGSTGSRFRHLPRNTKWDVTQLPLVQQRSV